MKFKNILIYLFAVGQVGFAWGMGRTQFASSCTELWFQGSSIQDQARPTTSSEWGIRVNLPSRSRYTSESSYSRSSGPLRKCFANSPTKAVFNLPNLVSSHQYKTLDKAFSALLNSDATVKAVQNDPNVLVQLYSALAQLHEQMAFQDKKNTLVTDGTHWFLQKPNGKRLDLTSKVSNASYAINQFVYEIKDELESKGIPFDLVLRSHRECVGFSKDGKKVIHRYSGLPGSGQEYVLDLIVSTEDDGSKKITHKIKNKNKVNDKNLRKPKDVQPPAPTIPHAPTPTPDILYKGVILSQQPLLIDTSVDARCKGTIKTYMDSPKFAEKAYSLFNSKDAFRGIRFTENDFNLTERSPDGTLVYIAGALVEHEDGTKEAGAIRIVVKPNPEMPEIREIHSYVGELNKDVSNGLDVNPLTQDRPGKKDDGVSSDPKISPTPKHIFDMSKLLDSDLKQIDLHHYMLNQSTKQFVRFNSHIDSLQQGRGTQAADGSTTKPQQGPNTGAAGDRKDKIAPENEYTEAGQTHKNLAGQHQLETQDQDDELPKQESSQAGAANVDAKAAEEAAAAKAQAEAEETAAKAAKEEADAMAKKAVDKKIASEASAKKTRRSKAILAQQNKDITQKSLHQAEQIEALVNKGFTKDLAKMKVCAPREYSAFVKLSDKQILQREELSTAKTDVGGTAKPSQPVEMSQPIRLTLADRFQQATSVDSGTQGKQPALNFSIEDRNRGFKERIARMQQHSTSRLSEQPKAPVIPEVPVKPVETPTQAPQPQQPTFIERIRERAAEVIEMAKIPALETLKTVVTSATDNLLKYFFTSPPTMDGKHFFGEGPEETRYTPYLDRPLLNLQSKLHPDMEMQDSSQNLATAAASSGEQEYPIMFDPTARPVKITHTGYSSSNPTEVEKPFVMPHDVGIEGPTATTQTGHLNLEQFKRHTDYTAKKSAELAEITRDNPTLQNTCKFVDALNRFANLYAEADDGVGATALGKAAQNTLRNAQRAATALGRGAIRGAEKFDPKVMFVANAKLAMFAIGEISRQETVDQAFLSFNPEQAEQAASAHAQHCTEQYQAFSTAAKQTLERLRSMPWEEVLENGSELGVDLVMQGVFINGLGKLGGTALQRFAALTSDLNEIVKAEKIAAATGKASAQITELGQQVAVVGKLTEQEGSEVAGRVVGIIKDNPELIQSEFGFVQTVRAVSKIEQKPHWESLALDPAHGNKISIKSIEEALAGIAAEEKGFLPGPIRRDPSAAAEFIDTLGRAWDVKTPLSLAPNGQHVFKIDQVFSSIKRELGLGENVILSMIKLNKEDALSLIAKLKTELSAAEIEKIITVFREDLF